MCSREVKVMIISRCSEMRKRWKRGSLTRHSLCLIETCSALFEGRPWEDGSARPGRGSTRKINDFQDTLLGYAPDGPL